MCSCKVFHIIVASETVRAKWNVCTVFAIRLCTRRSPFRVFPDERRTLSYPQKSNDERGCEALNAECYAAIRPHSRKKYVHKIKWFYFSCTKRERSWLNTYGEGGKNERRAERGTHANTHPRMWPLGRTRNLRRLGQVSFAFEAAAARDAQELEFPFRLLRRGSAYFNFWLIRHWSGELQRLRDGKLLNGANCTTAKRQHRRTSRYIPPAGACSGERKYSDAATTAQCTRKKLRVERGPCIRRFSKPNRKLN